MPWTPEQRSHYAPAISKTVRANATVRLASTIDAIDPPARTDRPRLWSTLTMLEALLCVVVVPGRRGLGAAPGRLPAAADDR